MRIILCSALYREVRSIARPIAGIGLLPLKPRAFCGEYLDHRICLVETGMGGRNSRGLLERSIDSFVPQTIVSVGYCGSMTDQIKVGEVVLASRVSLLEPHGIVATIPLPDGSALFNRTPKGPPIREAAFLTLGSWMEKSAVAPLLSHGSTPSVCDMETFHLAGLARERRIPFLALRGVSDGDGDDIRFNPLRLCSTSGFYSPTRAISFFLIRPNLLGRAIKLRRSSEIASLNLARAVEFLLREPNLEVPSWKAI